jgi:hypothetical protein
VEVAPPLAHAGALLVAEAAAVTDEPVADVVAPLVRHDLVVDAAVAVHLAADQRHVHAEAEVVLDRGADRERHGQHGNRDAAERAGQRRGRAVVQVVRDDDADGARVLRVLHLHRVRAGRAAVDERDLARHAIRDCRAAVAGRRDAVVDEHDRTRQPNTCGPKPVATPAW